jgi:hypothetical protein
LRALDSAGYDHLEQLVGLNELELSKLHGRGPKALGIVREALVVKNLKFKSE